MQVTVYWDVLWAVNFTLDFILLACTAFLLAKRFSFFRTLVAAAFGATYALCPLFETTEFFYQPVFKVLVAFLMVAIAMKSSSKTDFLKTTALFFLVSLLAGGTALAITNLSGDYFVFNQAKSYVIVATVFCIVIFSRTVFFRLKALLMRSACKLTVRVTIGEKHSETEAILDTGNELSCPITGKPIIIMNAEALQHILPPEFFALQGDFTSLIDLTEEWKSRIQILPYSALGTHGMLIAIKPDSAEISFSTTNDFKEVHALVGLAEKDFCRDKNYKALVSSQLLPTIGGAVA